MLAFFCGIKRYLLRIFAVISVFIVMFSFYYSVALARKATVENTWKVYYILSDSTHVDAAANIAPLQGGAGYLLEVDDACWVAYDVCFDVLQAKEIAFRFGEKTVREFTIEALYFPAQISKKQRENIVNAFRGLDGYMRLFEKEIACLENGATQQSCKRLLDEVVKQFAYLQNAYQSSLPKFSAVYAAAGDELRVAIDGIVYAKDLRYILCGLAQAYIRLSQDYTL